MFKRVAILLFCLLIVFIATFGFAVGVVSVPTLFTYAADDLLPIIPPDGYQQVSSNNQLGDGFLAYCKSRDSEITSSVLGASSTVAYNTLATFCRSIGFNIADLQSHLWYLNENGQTKWFFDSTGINLYNQAFAYLIQEHDLEVGDQADVDLYDGDIFIDDDGNRCLVYRIDGTGSSAWSFRTTKDKVLQWGSPLKYDFSDLKNMCPLNTYVNLTYNLYGRSYIGNLASVNTVSNGLGYSCFSKKYPETATENITVYSCYDRYWAFGADGFANYGNPAILLDNNGKYYIGIIGIGAGYAKYDANAVNFRGMLINTTPAGNSNTNVSNVTVNFTTNNNVINNNIYEGDTIINNDGDVIVYPDNPDQPDYDDPYEVPYNPYPDNPDYDPNDPGSNPGTVTPPINPIDPDGSDNVNIDFPDFDLNLPEINWSLGDLSKKFPFSIPFDMVSLVRVLDAPAEAPRFEGTVNFGFTTWDYDINLDSFSSVAAVCRIVETLLFVFGLILITRNLIKG